MNGRITGSPVNATPNNHAGLIWAIADLLRRLDCVLEPTKAQVLARVKIQTVARVLQTVTSTRG